MNILIADDHRLIVEAVAEKLAELGPDVCVRQALSVAELLHSITPDLDLALIDLGMPGALGVSHIAQVHALRPDLRIAVISGVDDLATMQAAMKAGARGFIPKAYSPDVMLSAVKLMLSGDLYVPPIMLSGFSGNGWDVAGVATIDRAALHDDAAAVRTAPNVAQLRRALTDRQRDVLSLLLQGQPNKQIGRNLGISEGTVKIHLAAIFRVLKVHNRTEAVVAARALDTA